MLMGRAPNRGLCICGFELLLWHTGRRHWSPRFMLRIQERSRCHLGIQRRIHCRRFLTEPPPPRRIAERRKKRREFTGRQRQRTFRHHRRLRQGKARTSDCAFHERIEQNPRIVRGISQITAHSAGNARRGRDQKFGKCNAVHGPHDFCPGWSNHDRRRLPLLYRLMPILVEIASIGGFSCPSLPA